MLGSLKHQKPYQSAAKSVYAQALQHIRLPVFYTEYGVPDTLDGRFDLLCVHIFMVMHVTAGRPGAETFNQALFDVIFADMDQMLREMGIGDMGIPKRMRRMMTAFNGRVHVYDQALDDRAALKAALAKNLYSLDPESKRSEDATRMAEYMLRCIPSLKQQGADQIIGGAVSFDDPA